MLLFLLGVLLRHHALGLEMVSDPDRSQMSEAGESATLECQVDSQWQWCYWHNEDTGVKFSIAGPEADTITSDERFDFLRQCICRVH